MKSSVFHLRPDPGARRQSDQSGRQSVEQALYDAISQFVRFFPWADEPVSQQHSKSVHERPAGQNSTSDPPFVAWRIRNGASQSSINNDACKERLCFLGRGSFDGRAAIIRAAQVASEHQSVERRVFDTMLNVGAQHGEQLRASITVCRDFIAHALCQLLEPGRGDGRQQLTFLGKVLVRSIVTDAGAPREFTQRKLDALRFPENFERGPDDSAAQIAVVVRTVLNFDGRGHGLATAGGEVSFSRGGC